LALGVARWVNGLRNSKEPAGRRRYEKRAENVARAGAALREGTQSESLRNSRKSGARMWLGLALSAFVKGIRLGADF